MGVTLPGRATGAMKFISAGVIFAVWAAVGVATSRSRRMTGVGRTRTTTLVGTRMVGEAVPIPSIVTERWRMERLWIYCMLAVADVPDVGPV